MKTAHIIPIGTTILQLTKLNSKLQSQVAITVKALEKDPEKSAEISAVIGCKERPDAITLLYTNTPEGIFCKNVLTSYFKRQKISVPPAIKIEDIHVISHSNPEQSIANNLIIAKGKIRKTIQSYINRGYAVSAHITGGFKSLSAIIYSVAESLGIPTYYKHEYFKKTVLLPGPKRNCIAEPTPPTLDSIVKKGGGNVSKQIITIGEIEYIANKDYLKVQISDGYAPLTCFLWNVRDKPFIQTINNSGAFQTYEINGHITVNPIAIDITSLVKCTTPQAKGNEEDWGFIKYIIGALTNPYQTILKQLFDTVTEAKFKRCPAAKKIHHQQIGGLAKHTANMLKIGIALCDIYPHVDRNLLLAAIIIHDIGKIDEFKLQGYATNQTQMGKQLGHICCGFGRLIQVNNSSERTALLHCLVSHHGRLEYGSPVEPQTLEAKLLHQIDMLDATEGKHQNEHSR